MATKRKYRALNGSAQYLPWKHWEVDDFVEGKFLRVEQDNYKKDNYILEILDRDFANEDDHERFRPGTQIGLNHNGILGKVMESGEVDFGDIIKVTYRGTSTINKGPFEGREAHTLTVEVAEEELGPEYDSEDDGGLGDDDGGPKKKKSFF